MTILRDENRVLLADLHESTAQVARQEHLNKELEEKSMKVIALETKVELLSNQLKDYSSLKHNMDHELNVSQLRVTQYKDIVRDENSGKMEL